MDDVIREMLEPERPEPGVVARRRRFIATTAIIGLAVAGVTGLTTSAIFTSEADSGRSGFVSGSIDIDAGETSWSGLVPSIAAPGDTYFAAIPVSNEGTLQLRYAMELSATAQSPSNGSSDLLDFLTYSIYHGAPECTAAGVASAGATRASTAVLSSAATHQAVGDKARGHQSVNGGDRTLQVNASETLCLQIDFDIDADDSVQLHSAALDFTFYAEQTANN